MEIILIFLLFVPLIGYVLQKVGMGLARDSHLLLKLDMESMRPYLIDFTCAHGWQLLQESPQDDSLLFVFRTGQFTLRPTGVQQITVTFFPETDDIKCFIRSESLFGQIFDFGKNQKNVDGFAFYFNDLAKGGSSQKQRKSINKTFLKPKPIIDYKYFVVLSLLLVGLVFGKAAYMNSRPIVSGYMRVQFQPYVTRQLSGQLLRDFGALHCREEIAENNNNTTNAYMCEVPIGSEREIANKVRLNPTVKSSEPRYKE